MKIIRSGVSVLLVFILTLGMFSFSIDAAQEAAGKTGKSKELLSTGSSYTIGKVTYEVTDKQATITSYNDKEITEYSIPSTLGGYPVVAVANDVFKNFSKLASVTFPDSLEYVGENAFNNTPWYNNQPDGLVYAGNAMYKYKGSMPNGTTITIKSGTKSITPRAFSKCKGLKEVVLPSTTKLIGYSAFDECTSLQKINLVEGITSISSNAFSGCSSLANISLPSTLSVLEHDAFASCSSLTQVTIPKNVKTINYSDWYYTGVFADCENLKKVAFEEGMTTIPDCILGKTPGLEEVVLPSTTKVIGAYAFKKCTSLKKVNLVKGITDINFHAFSGCSSLASVDLPSTLSVLDHDAFASCSSLTEITIPKNVKTINYSDWYYTGVFADCENLKKVAFEEGMTTIPDCILGKTPGLEEVVLPSSTKVIGEYAFSKCTSLKKVNFVEGITDINFHAFSGCVSLASVDLPSTLSVLDHDAFASCSSLTEVTIPKNVKTINYSDWYYTGVFADCENLKKVAFEEGMTTIPDCILGKTPGLEEVVLPSTTKVIGEYAFSKCTSLKKVNFVEGITDINFHAFSGCVSLASVDLPSTLSVLDHDAFASCSSLTEVTIPKNVKTINYSDWYYTGVFADCENLRVAYLEEGMTNVPDCLFGKTPGLKDVYLSQSIRTVGNSAFSNCPNVTVHCPKYTKGMISLIDEGIKCVSVNDKRPESPKVLDEAKSSLTVTSGMNLSVNCKYSFKSVDGLKDTSVKIYLPTGADIEPGSLYINKKPCTDFKQDDNHITIPVSDNSGSISFNLELDKDCKMQSYAILKYKINNTEDYDIIDIVNEDVSLISISVDDTVSESKVSVSGIAPMNNNVDIYIDDAKLATFTANKIGSYSGEVTIPSPESGKSYCIKAKTTGKNGEIGATGYFEYLENAPKLSMFTMDYNGSRFNLLNNKKNMVTFRLEYAHGVTPFKFTVKYDNPETIDRVYISSTRNQIVKSMEAKYDSASGSYIAEGFFDNNDHDYVPGKISVSYTTKSGAAGFDLDKIDDEMNEPLPEYLKNATHKVIKDTDDYKEILITLPDEETITYRYQKIYNDEFDNDESDNADSGFVAPDDGKSKAPTGEKDKDIEKLENTAKLLKKVVKKGWKYYKAGEKTYYYQVDGEEKKTTYYDFEEGKDYIIKEQLEYSKKKVIDNTLTILGGEDLAPISKSTGYFLYDTGKEYLNYFGQAMEYNQAIAQVMASDLPEATKQSQIAHIRNMKMAAMDVAAAKMVGSYFKYASGIVIGECPPLGIALYVAGYAMADMYAKDPNVFDKLRMKVKSFNAYAMDFIIDPSGYVYEGVTSNRLANVTATAYWIAYDENIENFWDKPDESKAVVWESGEYSQLNPLVTDNDGNYAWDVPEGWWRVKYECEGYETTYSEWLAVPPPQTEVNINMVKLASPKVESVEYYSSGEVGITFDTYMSVSTVQDIKVASNDKSIAYTVKYNKTETDANGNVYAKTFILVLSDKSVDSVTVSVPATVKSYCEKPAEAFSKSLNKTNTTPPVIDTGNDENTSPAVDNPADKTPGDVNGDGDVDMKDVTRLQKYINKWNVEIKEQNSDVNGDGDITMKDIILLQKYINKWDVVLK